MPTLPRALAALTLLVAPLAACSDEGPAYGSELADYAFEKVHVAKLPNGERFAVGSVTGHDVTVQWGDGSGWTEPQKVTEDPLWTHDMTLREKEGTAAVAVDFWLQEKPDDDYAPQRTRVLVCRDHSCAEGPRPKELSSAHVSGDGRLIDYGVDRNRMAFWEDGAFRTEAVTGLPRQSALQPVPDGTFLAIGARVVGDLCHYDLYAAPRGSVAFALAARGPGYPDPKPCSAYSPEIDPEQPDRVGVYIDSSVDRLVFVREDGRWTAQVPAVRPIAYPDTRGQRTIAPLQLDVGGGAVLVGSPDLTRIVAQVRLPGAKTWGTSRTIARAPRGTVCRWAGGESSDAGSAMVVLHCFPKEQSWDPSTNNRAPVALVLATDDGTDWPHLTLDHPATEIGRGADYLLASGRDHSYVWRKGVDDFQLLRLPVQPDWDKLILIDDGERVLRLIGNPDPRAVCRPGWTVAPVTARRWPEMTPAPERVQRNLRRGTCSFSGYVIDDLIEANVAGMDFGSDFALVRDGATFRVQGG